MAHPKRRHSKSRKGKRRTHQKLTSPQLGKCSHCGALKQNHKICPSCGYYKGKKVLSIGKKKKKEKEQK